LLDVCKLFVLLLRYINGNSNTLYKLAAPDAKRKQDNKMFWIVKCQ